MIKKMILFTALAASATLFAAPAPILDYDFTAPVIVKGGRFKQPTFLRPVKIASPQTAIVLDGRNELTIPDSSALSLANGGTLHCVVNFKDNPATKEALFRNLDMVFFKPGDFLFGRMSNKIYFNIGDGQPNKTQWKMTTYVEDCPLKTWVALTGVLTKKAEKLYNVVIYQDGKQVFNKDFRTAFAAPSKEPVTLGKGWGGPWCLDGMIAKVMIFDKPLTAAEVAALTAAEPYIKK